MIFDCVKKYIVLPASFEAEKRRLLFYIDDKLVYDLVVSLDYEKPEFQFPVNLERFMGKTLRVECDTDLEVKLEETDTPVLDYSGTFRPLVHFTARRGWINDPNGLVYKDGYYHMYYQHNPTATTWENMHWGSAVSKDLMHWQEMGDVIFPDENGTIFSGSGIIDEDNRAGFGKDALLFFYTAAGNFSETSKGKVFTQRLAYSLDNGKTLVKYDKPVLEHIVNENRDPKVIYYKEGDYYILSLFLDEHEFALFRSDNLLDWTEIQRIELSEDAECPDFYPLEYEGEVKWVFIAASDRYFIGSFDGEKFTPETKLFRLNYGPYSYASQSWSDLLDGRRVRTGFAGIVIPGEPFGCCMDIPKEMSLKKIDGELKLTAWPVKELENLYLSTKEFNDNKLSSADSLTVPLNSKACDVSLTIKADKKFSMNVYGLNLEYDPETEILKVGDSEARVHSSSEEISLRIIYDTIYAEVYAAEGSMFMGIGYKRADNKDEILLKSESAIVKKLVVSELGKFYE